MPRNLMSALGPLMGLAALLALAGCQPKPLAPVAALSVWPQSAETGQTFHLDAADSRDLDKTPAGPLAFRWDLDGDGAFDTAAYQTGAASAACAFTTTGTFTLSVEVRNARGATAVGTEVVTVLAPLPPPANRAPVAASGSDQTVVVGARVFLDGSLSRDSDASDRIAFRWSLVSGPTGTTWALSDPNSARPYFNADRPGLVVWALEVSDGRATSAPSVVSVKIRPEADILLMGTGDATSLDYAYTNAGTPTLQSYLDYLVAHPSNRRGFASLFIRDPGIMVDFSWTDPQAMVRAGLDVTDINAVVFTHNHGDHCDPDRLGWLIRERRDRGEPLEILGNAHVISRIQTVWAGLPGGAPPSGFYTLRQTSSFSTYTLLGNVVARPLSAHHSDNYDPTAHTFLVGAQDCHIWLLDLPNGKTVMAAWDTGAFEDTKLLPAATLAALDTLPVDLAVMDATSGEMTTNTVSAHGHYGLLQALRTRMIAAGTYPAGNDFVATHLAPITKPVDLIRRDGMPFGVYVPYDGEGLWWEDF